MILERLPDGPLDLPRSESPATVATMPTDVKPGPDILFCIPVMQLGGTEIHLLHLAIVLKAKGYNVSACVYHEWSPDMVRRFEEAGVKVLRLNWPRANNIFQMWKFCRRMRDVLREHRASIVHVQYLAPAMLVILAARMARVRAVLSTVHVSGRGYESRLFRFLLKTASRFCSAFFAVSRSVETFWFGSAMSWSPDAAAGGRRHFTIYNGIDWVELPATGGRRPEGPNSAVIGFLGRLVHLKGADVLLQAMRDIVPVYPSLICRIAGDGSERGHLEQLARSLGLSSNIQFLGGIEPDAVPSFLESLDLVVVPSRWEGFGLVAAEAMAKGLPVVASRVDGLAEVVAHGETGLLVPPDDPAALAQAVVSLISDPKLARKMGERGRESVRERFSQERFEENWLSVYRYYSRMTVSTNVSLR